VEKEKGGMSSSSSPSPEKGEKRTHYTGGNEGTVMGRSCGFGKEATVRCIGGESNLLGRGGLKTFCPSGRSLSRPAGRGILHIRLRGGRDDAYFGGGASSFCPTLTKTKITGTGWLQRGEGEWSQFPTSGVF